MAASNFYLGLRRGDGSDVAKLVRGNASNGSNSDIELRIQLRNEAGKTNLTRAEVLEAIEGLKSFIAINGLPVAAA